MSPIGVVASPPTFLPSTDAPPQSPVRKYTDDKPEPAASVPLEAERQEPASSSTLSQSRASSGGLRWPGACGAVGTRRPARKVVRSGEKTLVKARAGGGYHLVEVQRVEQDHTTGRELALGVPHSPVLAGTQVRRPYTVLHHATSGMASCRRSPR